jgi:hypothetical protein
VRIRLTSEHLRALNSVLRDFSPKELKSPKFSYLRGHVAEYLAALAFRRWIKKKYESTTDLEIWAPPLTSGYVSWGRHFENPYLSSIYRELLMPELKPLYEISKEGGSKPDLVAKVRLKHGIVRYYIEVKYGRQYLDPRDKLALKLAKVKGYVPIFIRVKRISFERNFFDVSIKEKETSSKFNELQQEIRKLQTEVKKIWLRNLTKY